MVPLGDIVASMFGLLVFRCRIPVGIWLYWLGIAFMVIGYETRPLEQVGCSCV